LLTSITKENPESAQDHPAGRPCAVYICGGRYWDQASGLFGV